MSVGLVLEGGAMRGMYTAGVLDIFMDHDIPVDGIVGSSAGVLFGVNYPSRQRGRVIRYNKKYAKDPRYMGLRSFLTTGNIINKEFSFYTVPQKLDVFDQEAFEKSGTDFYATITNVETGQVEYRKLSNLFDEMEVLRATSAMPLVSKMVELDGKKYLDGGLADSIPVEKCKALGYDKIIVVLTRPLEYRKKPSNRLLYQLAYGKYPDFVETLCNRYQNYNDTVEKIIDMENNKEIFVIRPSRTVDIKRIERDENKLQEMYDLGVEDCNRSIEALKQYLGI
ncbi:MAG: patatin-like phospholipase family protein [Lachnospiraceae bacterium]|nr:patatin-like phospholipase family protein [Lachnospiraceae bacterium]